MSLTSTVILCASGLLPAAVGTARICNPVSDFAAEGIRLPNDVNLLNEMRGLSAVMLGCAFTIWGGAVTSVVSRQTSHLVALLLLGGFAVGRIVGWVVDGKPNAQIVRGLMFEGILAATNVVMLLNINE